jgi:glycosyltransferase involved in cell wall biosynthesis
MKTKSSPLFSDVGILALIYHNWDSVWMTPHHVLTRLAHYFHIVWSEPPHGWRDVYQSLGKKRISTVNSDFSIPPGFQLYIPEPWLPKFYRPDWLSRFTFGQRLRQGARLLKRKGCRKFVLYLWHPQFEPALYSYGFDLKLYHIDDDYSFLPTPPPIDPGEVRVLSSVDQVFVVSPRLLERKGGINPHTTLMPEGVDYQLYATPSTEPDDLAGIPRPRIGYTGNLKAQLDWSLLRELVRRHSEWQFVFVGPPKAHPGVGELMSEMSQRTNVHFLGPKSVTTLASYPQHFDVCIMPYRVNEYTNNIYPLKLHEYLASGRPVVGSPIRSLQDFSNVIALADGLEEWSHTLARALEPTALCPQTIAVRQKIARDHDWGELLHSLARTICDRLGPEYSEQLRALSLFSVLLC